eukprot:gnl/TRDRNA2_/TRDRNA2_49427_c0_seq1.p1 gnl/TRDRNA2_/TRDRNA2_49427_c0~~gnl/TRDRNA2_/TRDRNA2_49427_c0_seq1.p1  ORF type:complete len:100 (-),score=6.13 gnl/TRDRNA2_/TRDRNA2_49427_c0_seq1:45-344(-)
MGNVAMCLDLPTPTQGLLVHLPTLYLLPNRDSGKRIAVVPSVPEMPTKRANTVVSSFVFAKSCTSRTSVQRPRSRSNCLSLSSSKPILVFEQFLKVSTR